MIEITFSEEDMNLIRDKLSRLSLEKQDAGLLRAFKDAVFFIEEVLKKAVSNDILKVRSGRLRSSIQSIVVIVKDQFLGIIGSGARNGKRVKYASILEDGGTIVAKPGGALTIPFRAALTSAGVMKYPSARDYPNTWLSVGAMGKAVILQKVGKKRAQALFLLVKSVHIPGKKYMAKTVERAQAGVMDVLTSTVGKILEGKR